MLPHDGNLTNANATYATELVNKVSLQTSSSASASQAGSFNFTLSDAGLTTSSSVLSTLVMNFTIGQDSEPWNSDTDDSKLYVHVNGSVVEVSRAQIKASSNNIIEELDEGFHIVNTGVNTNGAIDGDLPKATIYFYGNVVPAAQQNASNSFRVNQINGMGAYAVIDQKAGAKEYPFFVTYTTPTASGNKKLWYKSNVLYAPDAQNNQWNIGLGENPGNTVINPSRVGLTLLYTGTDDPNFRPDIPASRRVKHVFSSQYSDANATYATELVNLVSLQTSSNALASQAGNFNFTLSEAGLTTSSSVLSTLVMSFTKNLVLNIPVDWESEYAHSVKVGYKYSNSDSVLYTEQTFDYDQTGYVSLYVEPTRGTTLYYSVAYIINNPNPLENAATHGLTVKKNVPNLFFPSSSDYTITEKSYQTFNTGGRAAVLFTLTFNSESTSRIDGLHVYFNSSPQQQPNPIPLIYDEYEAGTWTNSNVYQLGGSGAPKLTGSSDNVDSNSTNFWSFSESTWVSTVTNSNGTRTATYTGGTLNSRSFTGPVTITTTYGVNANSLPNTDIQFSILDNENGNVILSSVTLLSSLVFDQVNKTITGTISGQTSSSSPPEPSPLYTQTVNYPNHPEIGSMSEYIDSEYYASDSNIPLTRIQSYTKLQPGAKNIKLLYPDNTINFSSTGNFTMLRVMDNNGVISDSDGVIWRDYDSATIELVAYRDRRVISSGAAYNTENHVESTGSDLDLTIWNVPKLQNPSFNGPIEIDGGVINSSVLTRLHWVAVYDMNGNPFKYDLTMMKNDTVSIHDYTFDNALTSGGKTLDISTSHTAKYTVTLNLVFDPETPNAMRESSSADTITFYTIKVDNSDMDIEVQVPSDTSNVNLKWNANTPVVSGNSITLVGGSVPATFDENVNKHYIEYSTTNPIRSLNRLAPSQSNLIEKIVSPATKKQYALPHSDDLAAVYSFFMHIAASIDYRVQSVLHSALGEQTNIALKTTSSAKIFPTTATTAVSQYVVSGIPIITLPSQTPVLLTGQTTPTLLLGLDANGLEDEGFISVLVILTQDGTASNPEGEHALLVFPNSGASFNYSNAISQTGGDARLIPGDPYSSTPRDIADHSMSTHANQYTLTIGTVDTDGRYGFSTLQMPSSENSGFVDGDVNYMIILTTRRGVDIKTGMFTYQSLPSVENVQIVTENGQFFVQFNITPV